MRLLTCTVCNSPVEVHEEPVVFLDPERYTCGDCQQAPPQLELIHERTGKRETLAYDPRQAAFPEGF